MKLRYQRAFSLVEVVIALGIVSFAIVAILGLIPTGLQTSHSSQDETRATQIAQSILSTLAAQNIKLNPATGRPILDAQNHAQLNDAAKLPPTTTSVDLSSSTSYSVYANNDGQLSDTNTSAVYVITIATSVPPANFDAAYAKTLTVAVAWPSNAQAANQTKRDFVRLITSY